jgi:UDP-glucose:(heptosyl)LPS alpha-1,3-glucosyltransferase
MRIALVVERLAATGGGVERAAWSVADALVRAGERVDVYCRAADAPDGVGVREIRVSDAWQPWRTAMFSRRVARRIREADAPYDVVHAFTRTRHQDVYRAGAGRHADFLARTHGALGAAVRRMSPRHARALHADRLILGDATQWIQCPSRRIRDDLSAAGVDASRLVVIPNGVDSERFRPGRDAAAEALRRRHAPRDALVWLFAGSGAHRKGLGTAIEALARSRDERGVLWVAGRDAPAPWMRWAERGGVGPRVAFLGARADMPSVYRAADALVLPTRYDPFANVTLEAAASGLPVVSTAENGAMEVMGDAGLVVDRPDDAAAVGGALDRLADPRVRRALGQDARKRAAALDWSSHAERLRALYHEVVARRARAARSVV